MLEWCERIRSAKNIWIYGAGVVAMGAMEIFTNEVLHLSISGVVVSNKEKGAAPYFYNFEVKEIGEIEVSGEDLFIVAVGEKNREGVVRMLTQYRCTNYIVWEKEFCRQIWRLADYSFEDRRKNKEKVCFVLCGYKEFLWEDVFDRLKRFVPSDVEVCLLSSGIYHKKLSDIARVNNWSYLYTERNHITLIQNIAYELYDGVQWIYKMDEDIFLTENCFENLFKMHVLAEEESDYQVGFTAPLIPLNGYGYVQILDKLGQRENYEKRFGRVLCGGNYTYAIENNPGAGRFMWGEGGFIPKTDILNKMFSANDAYKFCNVRFSIGFIMFHNSLWKEMNGFSVREKIGIGLDERELCSFCMIKSKAIVVAENAVVGHFAFGRQTEDMKAFYVEHPEFFRME